MGEKLKGKNVRIKSEERDLEVLRR